MPALFYSYSVGPIMNKESTSARLQCDIWGLVEYPEHFCKIENTTASLRKEVLWRIMRRHWNNIPPVASKESGKDILYLHDTTSNAGYIVRILFFLSGLRCILQRYQRNTHHKFIATGNQLTLPNNTVILPYRHSGAKHPPTGKIVPLF